MLLEVNGLHLYYESVGSGEPLLMVHGSWGDHNNWAAVVPGLAQAFQVTTYDRRGHSQSERPAGQGSVREDVADLAALIEALDIAPAHLVGNSFGASIALRLAGERPELLRTLVVHEPPLLKLLEGRSEFEPMLAAFNERAQAVIDLLRSGQMEPAAQQFVDTIAFGPGAWDGLPQPIRDTFVRNGPTWLDETQDPDSLAIELPKLSAFDTPVLGSKGTESPPFFGPIVDQVLGVLPRATAHLFGGAGHVPHITHPQDYVQRVTDFCKR